MTILCINVLGSNPSGLCYSLVQRVVRATMTTTSIVSVKFFTYLFMGSAQFSDVPLYCLAIVSAYIGLNIGNAAAKRMNQEVGAFCFCCLFYH